MNIRSMNPSATSTCNHKHKELKKLIKYSYSHVPVKFIAITETWLRDHIRDAQIFIEGFNISRCDRGDRSGGGVLLYSDGKYPVTKCEKYDDSHCLALFVKFSTLKLGVFVIYRPPDAPGEKFRCALNFVKKCIEEELDRSFQVCLVGDLNFPNIDWRTERVLSGQSVQSQCSALDFLEFLDSKFLNQYVDQPTRGVNILDLFCTDNPELVQSIKVSPLEQLSDHSLVSVLISIPVTELDGIQNNRTKDDDGFASLNFSKADYPGICDAIRAVNWTQLECQHNVEDYPAVFTKTLLNICRQYVPTRRVQSSHGRMGRPREVNALRRRRKRLKQRISLLGGQTEHPRHADLQRKLTLLDLEIKSAYQRDLERRENTVIEKIKSNPKVFYSYAKSHSVVRGNIAMLRDESGRTYVKPEQIANVLQNHFSSVYSDPSCEEVQGPQFDSPHIEELMTDEALDFTTEDVEAAIKELKNNSAPGPDGVPAVLLKNCSQALAGPLTSMWKRSFREGVVPAFYKMSLVSPLHKKGDKITPGNYRPVSLTSHIVKVFERVLKKILVRFLETNSLISSNQHGFRSGRSTLTQLLAHVDDILTGWCRGLDSDCIYLDYAKAFDKVDHALLIKKLELYSVHPIMLKWIESFLMERKQCVVVNGNRSNIQPVISGVPQGSVLGPVLFVMFINDLERVVTRNSTVRFFADDTRISKHIGNAEDHFALQDDLNSILEWAKRNNMQLHEQKFELSVHRAGPATSLESLPFTSLLYAYQVSEDVLLSATSELKDLGVRISADLSWKAQISSVVSKSRSIAAWVLSVFRSREPEVMMTLYKTYVRSQLEYCSILWHPQTVDDIEVIEGVQRTFTSKIVGLSDKNYWERLEVLNLMSLQRRRERYIIIMMWKIFNGFVPNDMKIQSQLSERRGLKALYPNIPRGCRSRVKTQYDSSFAYIGPKLWNILPKSINSIGQFHKFKGELTKFVLSIPDKPPVCGYARTNDDHNRLYELVSGN